MDTIQIIFRIVLSIIIGGAIGYEREQKSRPAGFRTHILVCMGAAIITMIQIEINSDIVERIYREPFLKGVLTADMGRLGAQVISGIGFIGAGTIMHERGSIRGLTTAASLWVVACIGLSIGFGKYFLSISAGIAIVLILVLLKKFEDRIPIKNQVLRIEVIYSKESFIGDKLNEILENRKIIIKSIEYKVSRYDGEKDSIYTVKLPKKMNEIALIEEIQNILFVKKVRLLKY